MSSPFLLGSWVVVCLAATLAALWWISRRRLRAAMTTVNALEQAGDALDSGDLELAERL